LPDEKAPDSRKGRKGRKAFLKCSRLGDLRGLGAGHSKKLLTSLRCLR
jgi:hypothetical protein